MGRRNRCFRGYSGKECVSEGAVGRSECVSATCRVQWRGGVFVSEGAVESRGVCFRGAMERRGGCVRG